MINSNKFKISTNLYFFSKSFTKINKISLQQNQELFYLSGRLIEVRNMGKSTFLRIIDESLSLQLFANKKSLGLLYTNISHIKIGCIIGVTGIPMKTKTGELTLRLYHIKVLTHSSKLIPDKLSKSTKLYKHRHLDLSSNYTSRQKFIIRTDIQKIIRNSLNFLSYLEVETPILTNIAFGASAKPFFTYHNSLNEKLSLRIATEIHLKYLLVGGFDKIYEIGRLFRNEGISSKHNPEFTSIEFYQTYKTHIYLITFIEKLFRQLVISVKKSSSFSFFNINIYTFQLFLKISVINLLSYFFSLNLKLNILFNSIIFFSTISSMIFSLSIYKDLFYHVCLNYLSFYKREVIYKKYNEIYSTLKTPLLNYKKKKKIHKKISLFFELYLNLNRYMNRKFTLEIIYYLFENKIESHLIQPTFVTDYPINVSPLAYPNDNDQTIADRFELFCCGFEIANAFSELTDSFDQKNRFIEQINLDQDYTQQNNDKKIDTDFIKTLEYGMPPTAGAGIGIDRITMLFTDSSSIKDVIFFPKI